MSRTAAVIAVATMILGASGASAEMTDKEAYDLYVREILKTRLNSSERFKPAFEAADAASFVKPYDPKAGPEEKAARAAWYKAQIPAGFPKKGAVRVVYLNRCSFPPVSGADPGEVGDAERAAADRVWIALALEREKVKAPDLSAVARDPFGGSSRPSTFRKLNQELLTAPHPSGPMLVLQPYCGPTYFPPKNDGLPSPPPPPPPPPPAPPPPSYTYVQTTPGTTVYVASAMKAELCRIKTGKVYRDDCKGWWPVLGDALQLAGTLYRYVIISAGRIVRSDVLDLQRQEGTPDHPIRMVVS